MQCMTRSFFSFPFLSFFSVSAYRTTVFQCILNSGVLVGGAVIFLEVLIKKKKKKERKKCTPWSLYGCKVTDWSTVTLTFNFPPGVLARDLEGAHFFFTGETA